MTSWIKRQHNPNDTIKLTKKKIIVKLQERFINSKKWNITSSMPSYIYKHNCFRHCFNFLYVKKCNKIIKIQVGYKHRLIAIQIEHYMSSFKI